MVKIKLVDPPDGWRYGFPAPLQKNYRQQLIKAGYPKQDIDFAIKRSRYWETANETQENTETKKSSDGSRTIPFFRSARKKP